MKFIVETPKVAAFATDEIEQVLSYMARGLTADVGVVANCSTVDASNLISLGNGALIAKPHPKNSATYI
jgi:hypothetical protein